MPRATGTSSRLGQYEEAWESINRLIRRGGSWSGRERNCLFLHRGDGSFANFSAASGLDFEIDGRAVAVWDFDRDGDQDLLLKSRTGPQLKILRNESVIRNSRIEVRLEGRVSNRQAIGARVEVRAGDLFRVKEVRAGSGYLSQNSSTLFFGLGANDSVESLTVRWPSGRRQVFKNLATQRSYFIVEGENSTRSEVFRSPDWAKLEAGSPQVPETVVSSRRQIWLLEPLALPSLEPLGLDGKVLDWKSSAGKRGDRKPHWIELWSPDCSICLAELSEWGRRRAAGESPDIRLSAFALLPENAEARGERIEAARRVAKQTGIDVGFLSSNDLQVLTILIEDAVRWSRDLVVPTSLLIDAAGNVVFISQGKTSWKELQRDYSLVERGISSAERQSLALPFPGEFTLHDPHRNPFHLGLSFLDAGFDGAALEAFQRALRRNPEDAESMYNIGVIQLRRGQLQAAERSFQRALDEQPDFVDALVNSGAAAARAGRLGVARDRLRRALELRPLHIEGLLNLGGVELQSRRPDVALDLFERAARAEPQLASIRKQIGRTYRIMGDLKKSMQAYEKAAELHPKDAEVWSNLAVLHAQAGRLQKGHELCLRAIEIDPRYATAHSNDGLILERLGRLREARAAYEKAISIDPHLATAYLNLARAHLIDGQRDKAVQVLRRLLTVDPRNASALEFLRNLSN